MLFKAKELGPNWDNIFHYNKQNVYQTRNNVPEKFEGNIQRSGKHNNVTSAHN